MSHTIPYRHYTKTALAGLTAALKFDGWPINWTICSMDRLYIIGIYKLVKMWRSTF